MERKPKNVVIVGAGIAGLVAGVYARKAGHRVVILERGVKPGGLSTSWCREGYTFEGGMHWLVGSSSLAQPLNGLWREVGALQANNPISVKDPVITLLPSANCRGEKEIWRSPQQFAEGNVEYGGSPRQFAEGKPENASSLTQTVREEAFSGLPSPVNLWRTPGRMRRELLAAAPEDRGRIWLLSFDVYLLRLFQLLWGKKPWKYWAQLILLLVPFIWRVAALCLVSVERYAGRFRSAPVRALLGSVICSRHNAASLIYTLASYSFGDSGYPAGGSTRMAANIAATFESLGGELRYATPVSRIIPAQPSTAGGRLTGKVAQPSTAGGRLTGKVAQPSTAGGRLTGKVAQPSTAGGRLKVVCESGEEIWADDVIVTSDTKKAIDGLFEEPIAERWARRMREKVIPLECMFVGMGIEADLSRYSYSLRLMLEEPLKAGGLEYSCLPVYNYASVPENAPEGCTAITLMMYGDTYDYWKAAREEGVYEQRKKEVVDSLIDIVSRYIPEAAGHIVVTDMATPLTYERYCDNYKGAWMSIWPARALPPMVPSKCRTIPGLHFAGQRTKLSGGLPIALRSGRAAALSIDK